MLGTRIAVILALILSLCGVLYFASEASRYRGLYDDSQTALAAAQARTQRIQTNVSKVVKRNAELRISLDAALDANRDWADVRIPDAVRDSLCARARCVPVQPLSAPAD